MPSAPPKQRDAKDRQEHNQQQPAAERGHRAAKRELLGEMLLKHFDRAAFLQTELDGVDDFHRPSGGFPCAGCRLRRSALVSATAAAKRSIARRAASNAASVCTYRWAFGCNFDFPRRRFSL